MFEELHRHFPRSAPCPDLCLLSIRKRCNDIYRLEAALLSGLKCPKMIEPMPIARFCTPSWLCRYSIYLFFYPSTKHAIGARTSLSEHILLNNFSFGDHESVPAIVTLSSISTASSCTKYRGSLIRFISVPL